MANRTLFLPYALINIRECTYQVNYFRTCDVTDGYQSSADNFNGYLAYRLCVLPTSLAGDSFLLLTGYRSAWYQNDAHNWYNRIVNEKSRKI